MNVLLELDRAHALSAPSSISLHPYLHEIGMQEGVYLETMRDLMRLHMIGRFQDRVYLTKDGQAALVDRAGPQVA